MFLLQQSKGDRILFQDYAEIKKNENDDAKKMYDLEQSRLLGVASRGQLQRLVTTFEGCSSLKLQLRKQAIERANEKSEAGEPASMDTKVPRHMDMRPAL